MPLDGVAAARRRADGCGVAALWRAPPANFDRVVVDSIGGEHLFANAKIFDRARDFLSSRRFNREARGREHAARSRLAAEATASSVHNFAI